MEVKNVKRFWSIFGQGFWHTVLLKDVKSSFKSIENILTLVNGYKVFFFRVQQKKEKRKQVCFDK